MELTEDNHLQFFISKGFAHGFAVLSETAVFQYKCDEFYHPEADKKSNNTIMTQLSDKEHNAQMEDMKSFDEQMPCVGIFWYDLEDNTLFGVRKKELTPQMVEEAAVKGKPFINYPQLHRQVWAKEYFRTQAKHLDTKFKGDYTQIPRGRIAWTIDKFIVLVGKWAEPIQDKLSELLEEEFSLPYFEFVYDHHWDLGHGWSGDMPK